MLDVTPGILEKEWSKIEEKVAIAAPYTSWIHIDIADGTMVPVSTPLDFTQYRGLLAQYPNISFEAHLLVAAPEKYLKDLVDAGFKRLIVHVESNDPRGFLAAAKFEAVEVGIAIDGPTEVVEVEPFLEEIDFVLIAAIEEGASGQPFQPETVDKVKLIRQNFIDLPIAVVGGINAETARLVSEAGASRVISTSYLFQNPGSIGEAIEALKDA